MLFTIGMGGFTISLLIAGFATNAIYMDVFSGILGLFAAAVVPPAVGALGATYEKPSKRKNLAFACFSAGNPLGFVGGMIISGVAAHLANWRASFWALAVVYAIFTVLTVWTVPADGFARTPLSVKALKQFDILGMALVVVGFAFFSSSLSYVFPPWIGYLLELPADCYSLAADAPDGWKTGYVLALFIVGFFLLLAFLYWQSVAPHPLMPLWVWRDRNFSLVCVRLSHVQIETNCSAHWNLLSWLHGLLCHQLLPRSISSKRETSFCPRDHRPATPNGCQRRAGQCCLRSASASRKQQSTYRHRSAGVYSFVPYPEFHETRCYLLGVYIPRASACRCWC